MRSIWFAAWLLLIAAAYNHHLHGQQPIFAGNDTSICQGPITLTASVDSSLFSGAGSPTFLSLTDDVFSGVVNIGFSFTYFGNTYTECVISSNNFISFNLANANTASPWTISQPVPNTTFSDKTQNGILGPWQDINPGVGGSVSYQTLGTAPNRRFVVEYCNVPMFSCTNLQFSSQIIIYETTNIIETHIINKPLCTTWNNGRAIHALHDASGTIAFVVAGRNFPLQWTTANEGYRFTPTGPSSYQIDPIAFQPALLGSSPTVTWYEAGNPTPIGNGLTVSVNPVNLSTSYVAVMSGTSCGSLGNSDTVVVTLGASPVAITGNLTYCPGGSTSLSTNNTYQGYQWSTGETTQTINNVTQGTYTVTITSTGGCTATASATVTESNPNPVISSSNGSCIATNTILSVNPSFSGYNWSTGASSATINVPAGTYTVTVTDNFGCTGSAIFTGYIPPTPIIQGDSIYCIGDSAQISTTIPFNQYNWSTGQTSSTIYVQTGTYTVTVTDNNGCTGSSAGFVVDVSNPVVNISGIQQFCEGSSINISATAGFLDYSWNTGAYTPSINVTGGTYTVTVTDNYGCTDSETAVVPASPNPGLAFTASLACYGQNTTFSNSSTITSGTITDFTWDFGDGNSSNAVSPDHAYDTSGFYIVTLTGTTNDGCISTITDTVIVGGGPDVDLVATPLCFMQLQVTGVNNNSVFPVNNWIWDYGDFTQDTGQVAIHNYTTGGTYNVSLTATDAIGCLTTVQTTITTKGGKTLDQLQIPNVLSPNGDNINDVLVLDPEFEECSPYVLSIFNRWGVKVYEVENGGDPFAGISNTGSSIIPGTYFLVIRSGELDYHGTLTIFIAQ